MKGTADASALGGCDEIGMVAPLRRFELAGESPPPVAPLAQEAEEIPSALRPPTRLVSARGRVSFEGVNYHVGLWLAGEAVELVCRDGLLEVAHRGVLIACHTRRHASNATAPRPVGPPRPRAARAATAGPPVLRKVGSGGEVSFAGTGHRVGNAHRGEQVEMRLVGETVAIAQNGRLLRTWPARHGRSREHGAFSMPSGRPHRTQASRFSRQEDATQVLEPVRNASGETGHLVRLSAIGGKASGRSAGYP